jgi:hypothetical protein
MKINRKAKAATGSWEPLPAGQYPATLTGVEFKKSSKGNPMHVLDFQIEDSPRSVKEFILESNDFKWDQIANAFGVHFEEGEDFDFDTDDYVGKTLELYLDVSTYTNDDGEERKKNNIKYYIDRKADKTETEAASEPPPTTETADDDEEEEEVPF